MTATVLTETELNVTNRVRPRGVRLVLRALRFTGADMRRG
jgi:hypothetical protein